MDDVKQMLFSLQRFQILALFTSTANERSVSDSYAYAWAYGVYPLLNRSARWHQAYESCFEVREAQLRDLHELLEARWRAHHPITFFQLEDRLGIRGANRPGPLWDQARLVRACRYLRLNGQFDSAFWADMLADNQAPGAASVIPHKFEDAEIYFE